MELVEYGGQVHEVISYVAGVAEIRSVKNDKHRVVPVLLLTHIMQNCDMHSDQPVTESVYLLDNNYLLCDDCVTELHEWMHQCQCNDNDDVEAAHRQLHRSNISDQA